MRTVASRFIGAVADGTPAALIPLSMLAFGGLLGYRMFNLSVVASDDTLIIRNYLSTKRVPKDQIEGFRIGTPSMGSFGKAVMALLRDETVVSMDATARPFRYFGGQRYLESVVSQLRDWLAQ